MNKIILLIFVVLSFIIFPKKLKAQCFASPGNPIAGSANVGILQPRITRAVVFYRYSFANQYFEGNNVYNNDFASRVSSANYNYVGFNVGRGITRKFTLELEAGYFMNKTQNYVHFDDSEKGFGFSNAVISGKYNIYKDVVKKTEISVSGGVKMPFSTKPQEVNGVRLGIDTQPSTGHFGSILQAILVKELEGPSMRFILFGRWEKNFNENKFNYLFGDAITTSFFISKHLANRYTELTKDITVILQLRHEYKFRNLSDGNEMLGTGSNVLFLAPQINYNYNMVWNFSLIYDFPIYRYYNEIQLVTSYAISFSITRDFGYGI